MCGIFGIYNKKSRNNMKKIIKYLKNLQHRGKDGYGIATYNKDTFYENKFKGIINLDTTLFYSGFIPYYGQKIIEDSNFENRKYDYGLIPLIAKNYIGYKNIIELSSKSYLENDSLNDPHCKFEDLIHFNEGIIILSGSINSLSGNLFNKF